MCQFSNNFSFTADNCVSWPNAIYDVSSTELENDKGVKSRGICCVSEKKHKESLTRKKTAGETGSESRSIA